MNPTIDDLDIDYRALASVCKTADEEQHVFDWWIDHQYDTDGAVRELHRYRLMIRSREQRRKNRVFDPTPTAQRSGPERCEPEDLVAGLTPRQAEIWRLRALDLAYEDIGLRVGCSTSVVRDELDKIQIKYFSANNADS